MRRGQEERGRFARHGHGVHRIAHDGRVALHLSRCGGGRGGGGGDARVELVGVELAEKGLVLLLLQDVRAQIARRYRVGPMRMRLMVVIWRR